jgi:hypothetical protein
MVFALPRFETIVRTFRFRAEILERGSLRVQDKNVRDPTLGTHPRACCSRTRQKNTLQVRFRRTGENFWSLLKRGLKGTYLSVEAFHLFRYLDEQIAVSISARRLMVIVFQSSHGIDWASIDLLRTYCSTKCSRREPFDPQRPHELKLPRSEVTALWQARQVRGQVHSHKTAIRKVSDRLLANP